MGFKPIISTKMLTELKKKFPGIKENNFLVSDRLRKIREIDNYINERFRKEYKFK